MGPITARTTKNSTRKKSYQNPSQAQAILNKSLFNGKELQNDLNLELYDYNYRYYDPQIGRFISQDALVDKYAYMTPYQFAGNQVPNAIDLDGLEPFFPMGDGGYAIWGPIYDYLDTGPFIATSFSFSYEGDGMSITVNGTTNESFMDYYNRETPPDYVHSLGAYSVSNLPFQPSPPGTIESYSPSFMMQMSESHFINQFIYSTLDVPYVLAGAILFGRDAIHLNGEHVQGSDRMDALVYASMSLLGLRGNAASGVTATGQGHHLISKKITEALNNHKILKGAFDYSRKNSKYIYNALDDASHKGYEGWHRIYDATVVQWLQSNQSASVARFHKYLHNLHQQHWLKSRIPNVNLLD
jgi:RHS repeat-associated protein